MSPPEARLWVLLRSPPFRPAHFRRQVMFGPYYADFASHSARLVIEVDGTQHGTDAAVAHDTRRDAFLATEGYRVLRFATLDIVNHIDGVATAILDAVGAHR